VLNYERLRKRYPYYDENIDSYLQLIASIAQVVNPLSPIEGIVRDPNDDMMIACAAEARAQHIISRDKDLPSLGRYEGVEVVRPKEYMAILRKGGLTGGPSIRLITNLKGAVSSSL